MWLRLIMVSWLALAASGCQSARFYSQAVAGQWEIVSKRRSIDRVLADPATSPELAGQLRLVQALCDFAARELDLPAANQYTRYVDLKRPFVVWNVHAAPEFSLEARTWWYPVVGRLKYQGYFRKHLATDYGYRLQSRRLDVFIGGVDAYSTLGWFNDPVLNTFVHLPEAELADLIFHELTHRRLFIPGDTDFNEALATAVAREGVRRWFESRRDAAALARFQADHAAGNAVVELILTARGRLEALYAQAGNRTPEELRHAKADIIDQLRADYRALRERWPEYSDYDAWMAAPINNAQFNTIDAYHRLVPAFAALLARCQGDLPGFFAIVSATRKLDAEARRQRLLQPPEPAQELAIQADEPAGAVQFRSFSRTIR